MKMEDYFPDLPTPPLTGYFFMCSEKKSVIDDKLKSHSDYSEQDKSKTFKLRAQISKNMWDGKFDLENNILKIFRDE